MAFCFVCQFHFFNIWSTYFPVLMDFIYIFGPVTLGLPVCPRVTSYSQCSVVVLIFYCRSAILHISYWRLVCIKSVCVCVRCTYTFLPNLTPTLILFSPLITCNYALFILSPLDTKQACSNHQSDFSHPGVTPVRFNDLVGLSTVSNL